MNIPGFTAEYSMIGRKQFGGSVLRTRSGSLNQGVSPAATNTHHACYNLCRAGAAYPGCMDDCMAALGGDGGNGGPPGDPGSGMPDPVCGPCRHGRQHCVGGGRPGGWFAC